jgi:hypothetical protein
VTLGWRSAKPVRLTEARHASGTPATKNRLRRSGLAHHTGSRRVIPANRVLDGDCLPAVFDLRYLWCSSSVIFISCGVSVVGLNIHASSCTTCLGARPHTSLRSVCSACASFAEVVRLRAPQTSFGARTPNSHEFGYGRLFCSITLNCGTFAFPALQFQRALTS